MRCSEPGHRAPVAIPPFLLRRRRGHRIGVDVVAAVGLFAPAAGEPGSRVR